MPDDAYFEAERARLPRPMPHEDVPTPSTKPGSFTGRVQAALSKGTPLWPLQEHTWAKRDDENI